MKRIHTKSILLFVLLSIFNLAHSQVSKSINEEKSNMLLTANNTCDTVTVIGNVTTVNDYPLKGVEISLSDENESQDLRGRTLADGSYAIENMITCKEYEVKINANSEDWLQGVSTLDFIKLGSHILNIRRLSSPYELIAADVNGSGSITTFDMVEMRKRLLDLQSQVIIPVWKFVDATHEFGDPDIPFHDNFEDITVHDGNYDDLELIGIKIGDVDNSLMKENEHSPILLKVRPAPRNRIEFYFEREVNLRGIQFDLKYDRSKMRLTKIRTNLPDFSSHNFNFNPRKNSLRVSWANIDYTTNIPAGTPIASLSIVSNEIDECYNMAFHDSNLRAEIYENWEAIDLVLDCSSSTVSNDNTIANLYQNDPNPFEQITTVRFDLPERMNATLTFVSSRGQILHTVERTFEAGENQVNINRSMLGSYSGTVFYYLKSDNVNLVKRMVVE